MKGQEVTVHPMGAMNVCSKCNSYPFNSLFKHEWKSIKEVWRYLIKSKHVNPLVAEEISEDHRRLHRLGTIDVYTKLNGNSSSSSWDISIWTNIATSRAMPKAFVINKVWPIYWLANIIGLQRYEGIGVFVVDIGRQENVEVSKNKRQNNMFGLI